MRQNLALAHALAGDWSEARIIAAQDVPAGQLDARMQHWMQLAKPAHSADQVAALVGVTPAVIDAGQPIQLALNKGETREANAALPAPSAKKVVAKASSAAAAPPKAEFIQAAKVAAPRPAPVVAVAPAPPPPRASLAALASVAVSQAKAVLASVVPHEHAAKPVNLTKPASFVRAQARSGKSPTVVQLGAYRTSDGVLEAWNGAAHKFSALKPYMPMSARFASPKGIFYRLSVRGFDNLGEAQALCNSLRRQGGNCFVRNFAGDAPVNLASR